MLQEGQRGEETGWGAQVPQNTHSVGGAWAWDLRRGHVLNSSKPELDTDMTCEPSEAFE